MKWFVIGFGLLVSTGVTLWKLDVFKGEKKIAEPKNVHKVKLGDLPITLTERGTLKAKKSTQIRAQTHGKISWLVDEGTAVKKGDILVKMDTEQVKQQIDTMANQITQMEADLKSAETDKTVQEGQNKTNIEKAELNLEVKRVELEKLMEADIPAEERKLKLAIKSAEIARDQAKEKLAANRELQKEDFVPMSTVEDAELALEKAENDLVTSKMNWSSYLKYKKPLDIRQKKAAVVEADRGLERAKKQAIAHLLSKTARVQQRKLNLTRLKQRHKKEVEKVAKMVLKAPTDGTILIGDPDNPWNNENIKVGAQVWNRMVLMTLPDSRELAVVIQVHEADIDKLEKGMKAFVKSETQKGQIFEAEITKIDTVANAGRRWGGDSVKRFKVELSLKGEYLDLKTGTSAEVSVEIGKIPDVLSVPAQAIHVREGNYFCYILEGNRAHEIRVYPGRSNDAFVEIKHGIEAGMRVLLSTPETYEEQPKGEVEAFEKVAAKLQKEEAEEAKKKAEEKKKRLAEERKKRMEEMRKKMAELKNKAKPEDGKQKPEDGKKEPEDGKKEPAKKEPAKKEEEPAKKEPAKVAAGKGDKKVAGS